MNNTGDKKTRDKETDQVTAAQRQCTKEYILKVWFERKTGRGRKQIQLLDNIKEDKSYVKTRQGKCKISMHGDWRGHNVP